MRYDVILWDWGGTLAHVDGQVEAFHRGATQAGFTVANQCPADAIGRLIEAVQQAEAEAACDPEHREADLVDVIGRWAGTMDAGARYDKFGDAVTALGQAWIGCLEPIPGALDAVRTLKERGYRMGLVSNCMVPPEFSRQELARHGYAEYLDFAVFSSGVGFRKPSDRIYEAAMNEAFPNGRPSDLSRVLFVGDSPALDVMAPASRGMATALVSRAPGAWPEEDYAMAKPTYRVDAVSELPDLLFNSE